MTALHLVHAGPPGTKEKVRTIAPTMPDLNLNQSKQRQCIGDRVELQAIADRMDRFKRMQRKFDAHGWNLHPLQDEATFAVHRKWGTTEVCHSLHDAAALLKRIGGDA
jgi:hypothetical protein